MRKIVLLVIVIVLIIIPSCKQEDVIKYEIKKRPHSIGDEYMTIYEELSDEIKNDFGKQLIDDNHKNINKLVTKKYSNDELETIYRLKINIFELNNMYKIEAIRLFNSGVYCYFLSDNKICEKFFDINGEPIRQGDRLQEYAKSITWVNNIEVGDPRYKVREFDSEGDYGDYYGRDFCISYHYTKEGYWIFIKYDDGFYANWEERPIVSILISEV